MSSPESFATSLSTYIYQYFEGKASIIGAMVIDPLRENQPAAPAIMVVNDKDSPFVVPLVQAFMEYEEHYNNDFERYAHALCLKIEEYEFYLHSVEEDLGL